MTDNINLPLEEIFNEITIHNLVNPEFQVKEMKEKIVSYNSKLFNLNFVYGRSKKKRKLRILFLQIS